jgi:hypothetical protein
MRTMRSRRGPFQLLVIFVGSQLCVSGCSDESKTSGTMVQVSEEAKQHIQSRRDVYKTKSQPRKEPTKVAKKR